MMSIWATANLFGLLVAAAVGLTEPELAAALRGDTPTRMESFTTETGKASGRGVGAIVIDRPIDRKSVV